MKALCAQFRACSPRPKDADRHSVRIFCAEFIIIILFAIIVIGGKVVDISETGIVPSICGTRGRADENMKSFCDKHPTNVIVHTQTSNSLPFELLPLQIVPMSRVRFAAICCALPWRPFRRYHLATFSKSTRLLLRNDARLCAYTVICAFPEPSPKWVICVCALQFGTHFFHLFYG